MSTRPIPQLPLLRDNLGRLISRKSVVTMSLRGTQFNLKQYASAITKRDSFTAQMKQFRCNYDIDAEKVAEVIETYQRLLGY
ncbi:hypothetical protein Glo7428_4329 [Gloeocapsa sp. PCC 7428]|uniref:hypothetical protein n=1 Tax=Gloeocapsa sp. PCC 7428 TaxID=1173026 RepID=UPI0002A612B3|nr:hypothetical protein [Gloeocapsa sp. PCC 7428]AFZ32773.1 hypothetical protein Glo7428_4329 [Gloeocapsa sp. PCC 7428]